MVKVVQNRTVIFISKEEHLTYHHVGGLDSNMFFLTDSKGEPIYAGTDNFEIYICEENDKR